METPPQVETENRQSLIEQAVEHHRAGRLQQAEILYREILAREPQHADALHLLGLVAHALGQHEHALALIDQAARLQPGTPVYHNSRGQALAALGRIEQAAAAYQRAGALAPDYAEAYNNLGTALQASDRPAEAIAAFRQAVTLQPDFAEAHYNLGNALHETGEIADAVDAYRRAVALMPEDADVHNNLGVALNDSNDLPAAIGAFTRASILRPDFAEAHYNLGCALLAQGRVREALAPLERALTGQPHRVEIHFRLAQAHEALGRADQAVDGYRRALQSQGDQPAVRQGFAAVVRALRFSRYDAELAEDLKQLLFASDINHQDLARAAASLLTHKYRLAERLRVAEADGERLLADFAGDELLIALLRKTVNVDPVLERALTAARRTLLLTYAGAATMPAPARTLAGALALQCFSNEYVFSVEAGEASQVEHLDARCAQLAASGHIPFPALEHALLLFALYRPLYALACAGALNAVPLQAWSPDLRTLIERALTEPLEEQQLATHIESASEIVDPTSRLVGAQYEQHPYPRWLDLPRTGSARLRDFLRSSFSHFTPPAFLDHHPQILVAGCGTGFEPMLLARMHPDAEILAIDLSRRSLAYAARMARKLAVNNVRFLQGDILQLGAIDRLFHMIECVGVLHHMADPLRGWRVLTGLLLPGGVMRIGLYSARAREIVSAARERIRDFSLGSTAPEIRAFRERVLAGVVDEAISDLVDSDDFYTLSACRDLLFHAVEHQFTLPQIRQLLAELALEFIGFDPPAVDVQQRYREFFPADTHLTDLSAWERFEALNPRTFVGMYTFWCHKRPSS